MRAGDVFKGQYLKADDLQGKRVRVTIDAVTMEDISKDEKQERRAVAHFVGKDRRLVLNRTNWTVLEDVCGSPDSDDWIGYTVTLYPTKVDFQGKRVLALRISDQPGDTVAPKATARPAVVADDEPHDMDGSDPIPF